MWKIIKLLLGLGTLAAIGWIAYKWHNSSSAISVNAIRLIPPDAIYCMTTEDPINAWKEISGSRAWSHLQGNSYFASLTASANHLDSIIRDNSLLFDIIGSRSLIVSAHMAGQRQYDFLFVVDLQEASGIKFLNEYVSGLSAGDVDIRKEKYKEADIITFHDKKDDSRLYTAITGSYFIASFSRSILTSSIDGYQADPVQSDNGFLSMLDEVSNDGLMRIYVNYELLPLFVSCYSNTANEYAGRISQSLKATALSLTIENDLMKAEGHTYIHDSIESYIRTLAVSGVGASEFAEIAPQRTAFALALGFDSFAEFFDNFEKNVQQDVADYKEYRESVRQLETYLDISLQENFIDWVGDEVVLLELQSSGEGVDNETAIVFKASNVERARKSLEYIEKMVRRKTPVKFKTIDHRGFAVNYLSMKGLFRLLLGKFFARYDKPYYTIVNNFVIFSNHPQTLESIIDDYLDKSTLARLESYREFRRSFDDESSVFAYINTPVLFRSLTKLVDHSTRVSMEKNREYIVSFQQVGFQLVPRDGGFKTLIAEKYSVPERDGETPALLQATTELPQPEIVEKAEERPEPAVEDPMALPYLYVKDLNMSSFAGFFPDSTVHFEVELKNGFKDGGFTEYYPGGQVRMKGHFKNDKRDGTWRLYDEAGELVLRRTYEQGEIIRERKAEE